MPNFALAILRPISLSAGTAYVIVLGVKVITFSPLIVAVLISSGVYKKSPCTTPLMFSFLNSLNATCNLSARPPL